MTQYAPEVQPNLQHGAYAVQDNGLDALSRDELLELLAVEGALNTADGRRRTLARRVSMGLALLGRIETYVAEQVQAGRSINSIPILKSWPAFQNSTLRAIKTLEDMAPPPDAPRNVTQLVEDMLSE